MLNPIIIYVNRSDNDATAVISRLLTSTRYMIPDYDTFLLLTGSPRLVSIPIAVETIRSATYKCPIVPARTAAASLLGLTFTATCHGDPCQ